jgi:hypothetical protein
VAVYLARRDRLSRLAPELHRVVAQSEPSGAQSESSGAQGESSQASNDVQLAALDAMIELGEPVSLTELEPFVTRYPTLTLILASRASGDSTPLLLKLLDGASNYNAYVATANLLLPRRSPEFTRRVMSSLRVLLRVNVIDPGSGESYGGGWAGDSGMGIESEKLHGRPSAITSSPNPRATISSLPARIPFTTSAPNPAVIPIRDLWAAEKKAIAIGISEIWNTSLPCWEWPPPGWA